MDLEVGGGGSVVIGSGSVFVVVSCRRVTSWL